MGDAEAEFFRYTAGFDGNWLRRNGGGSGCGAGPRGIAAGAARMIGVLEAIESLIGYADEQIGLIAVLRKSGNAMIHGDTDGQLQGLKGFSENHADTAAESEGLCSVGLRKKQGELIATDAERRVRSAHRFLQGTGNATKNLVATRMAVLIVHFLEAMEVQDDDTEWKSIATGAIEFFLERFCKETAIVEAGERVSDRTDLQLLECSIFHQNRNANEASGSENVHQYTWRKRRDGEDVQRVRDDA